MTFWWLSFVVDDDFAGACVVPAESMMEAMIEAVGRGCHPGGAEVSALEMPDSRPAPPDRFVGRLLSVVQVAEFDLAWRRAVH